MKRNRRRILLPGGNSCSQLTVHPKNWKQVNASVKEPWWISYRFYIGEKSHQKFIKGMNEYGTPVERRNATEALLKYEMENLLAGYNPVEQKYTSEAPSHDYVIHPDTPFCDALQKAFDKFKGVSKDNRAYCIASIKQSAAQLGFDRWPVKDIKRRHLLQVLENLSEIKKTWNNSQYNEHRAVLNIVYKILFKYETVESNLVHDIEVLQHAPAPRRMLTPEQFVAIDTRLKIENYRFWNFVNIFLRSGARLSEMARVQGENVDLERQNVKYLVKKGKKWEWKDRPISNDALPYWQRALINCGPKQYVFAKDLLPADTPIKSYQYTKRWRRWIKKPVDPKGKYNPKKKKKKRETWIDVDLYELKHTYTTLLVDALGEMQAARMNGHTTTEMVKKRYDLHQKSRKDDLLRGFSVDFNI